MRLSEGLHGKLSVETGLRLRFVLQETPGGTRGFSLVDF